MYLNHMSCFIKTFVCHARLLLVCLSSVVREGAGHLNCLLLLDPQRLYCELTL